jgi:hypothetical protein
MIAFMRTFPYVDLVGKAYFSPETQAITVW